MNKDDYKSDIDDMPVEFTREMLGKGVRGKYYTEYTKGPNTITVHYADGTSKTTVLDRNQPLHSPLQKRVDEGE